MSAVLDAARNARVPAVTIRAGDQPDVLDARTAGRVMVIDARIDSDPARWPAAPAAMRGATIVVTVRAPDAAIGKYAVEMARRGDRVLVIACDEHAAPRWRALRAIHQRSLGGFGHATRSAA